MHLVVKVIDVNSTYTTVMNCTDYSPWLEALYFLQFSSDWLKKALGENVDCRIAVECSFTGEMIESFKLRLERVI